MNILVINSGSGSRKCSLFQIQKPTLPKLPQNPVWKAETGMSEPGEPPALVIHTRHGSERQSLTEDDPDKVWPRLLRSLWDGESAVISGPSEIDVVGHRVVHGGALFDSSVIVNEDVCQKIESLVPLAPLHNRAALEGIRAVSRLVPGFIPHAAVFDTAFHRSLPAAASTYPGPWEWSGQGIRRYGFHGTNFRWCVNRAAQILRRSGDPELRMILCHLGGGCSLAAVCGNRSMDTTMGFTPLDGIAMSTRSGTVDPGILFHLLKEGHSPDELEHVLTRESGLKGLSGLAGDTRAVLPAAISGNPRAILARDVFIHRLRSGIGSMFMALKGKLDALVFTDAIGETEPWIRKAACEPLRLLGLKIHDARNEHSPLDSDIATSDSKIRVLIVKARENWQIARDCFELMQSNVR